MDERDVVRDLVAKLIEAVEASLDGSAAVREVLDELVRSGYEPRIILLADAAPRTGDSGDDDEPGDDASESDHRSDAASAQDAANAHADAAEEDEEGADLRYELTKLDRDFLRTVRIRSEGG
jgi:hypothetical protein